MHLDGWSQPTLDGWDNWKAIKFYVLWLLLSKKDMASAEAHL